MTEMFGEAWSPMSVPDLAPDDDDDDSYVPGACASQDRICLRRKVWPIHTSMETKLWGIAADLRQTFQFIVSTGLRP